MVLEQQQAFHLQCQARFEEDERNRNADKEEAKRNQKLTAAQEEAEILKYKRLAEAEAEAIRLQRARFSEDEKKRLKKLEED